MVVTLHDAELVEKVWGDDLRIEGIVVERLDGADHLEAEVRAFGPGPGQRLGVLLDHLGGTQIVRNDGHFGDWNQDYPTFELLDRLID